MALKFGTSGVRGLVSEMTDQECYRYARAFLRFASTKARFGSVALAGDLRSSTPRIMDAIAVAIRAEGFEVDACGHVATPAVMNHGLRHRVPSIMVTGSHIPDDRNGIKFNMPWGEVLKADEAQISAWYRSLTDEGIGKEVFDASGTLRPGLPVEQEPSQAARDAYRGRFVSFFPPDGLAGMRLVFYEHSCVSRDVLPEVLADLGAIVVRVGRSDRFVPVDTEAIDAPERLAAWVKQHDADALVSADGDADRPLLVDERGTVVRGDVLGILVSRALGADWVSTPVSCNTAVEKSGWFKYVVRTRIGSPYVIEGMQQGLAAGAHVVVGYEANGGFLTATAVESSDAKQALLALPTRDAALPIIAALADARRRGQKLSELVAALPPRFTASGLLRGFPTDEGLALVNRFADERESYANALFGSTFGPVQDLDFTDGARLTFQSGHIVHLRPSGNAPEFRCYTEAASAVEAERINHEALAIVGRTRQD